MATNTSRDIDYAQTQAIVPVKFVELHNPLFLAGTNHKNKLYANTSTGLQLRYNITAKQLYVLYKNEIALIPESNIGSMMPLTTELFMGAFDQHPIELKAPQSTHAHHAMKLDITGAQVSDPTRTIQNPRA